MSPWDYEDHLVLRRIRQQDLEEAAFDEACAEAEAELREEWGCDETYVHSESEVQRLAMKKLNKRRD